MNHNLKILKILVFISVFLTGFTLVFSQESIEKDINNIQKNLVDGNLNLVETDLNNLLSRNNTNQLNKVIIYTSYVNLYAAKDDYSNALKYANLAKEISDKTDDQLDDCYTSFSFARLYLLNSMYDKTIYHSNEALKKLTKYPNENNLRSKIYQVMGLTHSRTGIYSEEYDNYINKALFYAIKSKSILELLNAYSANTVMYYHKYIKTNNQKDLEKIFENAEISLSYINENNTDIIPTKAASLSYNNLASLINVYPYKNLSNNERYNLAEKYIKIALDYANRINNPDLKSTCYATFAEINENKGNTKQAEQYYLKAYEIAKSERNIKDFGTINTIVKLISNFYQKNNQPINALNFNKESLHYTQKAYEKAIENKQKSLEAFYNFEKKNEEIKQLKATNKIYTNQKLLYIALTAISIIGIIFMVYMFIYKQRLNKQKTSLLEAEKHETELTLQLEQEEKYRLLAEQKLLNIQQEHLHKKALAASYQLNHKNTFINELKEKIKDDKNFNLDKILKDERLMDNDFAGIQTIIQDIHPNFFKKMNEVSKSKLSTQDLNYAAYIYLNMDNQQISNILKVEKKQLE